jgi:hypothetical protein
MQTLKPFWSEDCAHPGFKAPNLYMGAFAGLKTRSPELKVRGWHKHPQLSRRFISGGQHCLKKGRLGLFMDHGGVHIPELGFAQKQLQFHFTEA